MSPSPERLELLREEMLAEGYQAYLVTGTDPHKSEYVAPRWRTREYLSGFTGSAGTLVITQEKAGLWTDSRYFLQAEKELEGTGISLFREEQPGVPSPQTWLTRELPEEGILGVDGSTTPWAVIQTWESFLAPQGKKIAVGPDLLDRIWDNRELEPGKPVWDLEAAFRGLTPRVSKLQRLRQSIQGLGADFQILCTLDDIAWLTNLRGEDVEFSPLFLCFAFVDDTRAELFVHPDAITTPLKNHLEEDGWLLKPYRSFYQTFSQEPLYRKALITPETTNGAVMDALGNRIFLESPSPTTLWKAKKEPGELEGFRRAHKKDARALIKFLTWFHLSIENKKPLSERFCAQKLRDFRAQEEGFLGESFETIPGWRGNGAIVHYNLGLSPGCEIQGSGLFLLDSGGQYLEGTTDVTRTLLVGTPTPQEIRDYTLVLKAHLLLGRTPFPQGTRGYQLDGLTRGILWAQGMNYGHGTGHGVGHVLGVHEGPQKISPAPINQILEPGMILSNEPGIYRRENHGIRIENLQVVEEGFTGDFGPFHTWETLTLVPYESRLIDLSLLTSQEIAQINAYHQRVDNEISDGLTSEETAWLRSATALLGTYNLTK